MSKSENILLKMEDRFKSFASLSEDITSFPLAAHIDSQVETNKEKSKKHGEVFTPLWLVDEMIGQVQWGAGKTQTLDLCAGYGQFSIRLARHFYNSDPNFNINNFLANHSFSELQLSSCYKLLVTFSLKINLFIGDSTYLGRLTEGAKGIWVYVESAGYWVCLTKTVHNIFFQDAKSKTVSEEVFVEAVNNIINDLNKVYEEIKEKMSVTLDAMKKSSKNRLALLSALNKATEETSLQKVDTPQEIVSEMLDLVEDIEKKSTLVLFNCEIIEQLIHKKKVPVESITFGYDAGSALEATAVEKIYGVRIAKWIEDAPISIPMKYSNDKIGPKSYIVSDVFGGKKFDMVLSNPPYSSKLNIDLDVKIINTLLSVSLAKEYVIVHPSTYLLDLKGKGSFNDLKNKVNHKVKSIKFFNGNKAFGIQLFVPCVIVHFLSQTEDQINVDYFGEKFSVESVYDITKFKKDWVNIVKPFYQMVSSKDNIWQHRLNKKHAIDSNKFYVQFARIRGNVTPDTDKITSDDFYTLVMLDSEKNKGIRKALTERGGPAFEFNSEVEQNNFLNYLKTDFARFCFSLLKNKSDTDCGEMTTIPWLDFTQEWNDEKLFNHFDINEKTQKYIREFLPDYYGIRNNV